MEVSFRLSAQGAAFMNPLHVIVRLFTGVASRARNIWFRALGVQITGYVWLRRVSIPRQWSDITIEAPASLDDGVVLLCSGPPKQGKLVFGQGTYINRYTMFDVSERILVGQNCMIGPLCYITDHDHGHDTARLVSEQELISSPVSIGDNVWIGAGVIILKGVNIGAGAVIAAGSVVTRSISPGEKVAGIPAAPIHSRGAVEEIV